MKIFDGFGFYSNYPVQKYKVDFFVEKLALVLECDSDSHRFYDQEYERQREQVILKKYALIRFPDKINIERLSNIEQNL